MVKSKFSWQIKIEKKFGIGTSSFYLNKRKAKKKKKINKSKKKYISTTLYFYPLLNIFSEEEISKFIKEIPTLTFVKFRDRKIKLVSDLKKNFVNKID